jgi:hypothetical protein
MFGVFDLLFLITFWWYGFDTIFYFILGTVAHETAIRTRPTYGLWIGLMGMYLLQNFGGFHMIFLYGTIYLTLHWESAWMSFTNMSLFLKTQIEETPFGIKYSPYWNYGFATVNSILQTILNSSYLVPLQTSQGWVDLINTIRSQSYAVHIFLYNLIDTNFKPFLIHKGGRTMGILLECWTVIRSEFYVYLVNSRVQLKKYLKMAGIVLPEYLAFKGNTIDFVGIKLQQFQNIMGNMMQGMCPNMTEGQESSDLASSNHSNQPGNVQRPKKKIMDNLPDQGEFNLLDSTSASIDSFADELAALENRPSPNWPKPESPVSSENENSDSEDDEPNTKWRGFLKPSQQPEIVGASASSSSTKTISEEGQKKVEVHEEANVHSSGDENEDEDQKNSSNSTDKTSAEEEKAKQKRREYKKRREQKKKEELVQLKKILAKAGDKPAIEDNEDPNLAAKRVIPDLPESARLDLKKQITNALAFKGIIWNQLSVAEKEIHMKGMHKLLKDFAGVPKDFDLYKVMQ